MKYIDPSLLGQFCDKKVLVIGDIMMDRYIRGDITRISPEAPVPILHVKDEDFILGGAGNVANNLAALGAKVCILGIIGNDSEGLLVKKYLEKAGIDTGLIIVHPSKPTIQKVRIVTKGKLHQLMRLDYEDTDSSEEGFFGQVLDELRMNIPFFDAVVVSDYAKGLFDESLAKAVISSAQAAGKPVVVDTKPKNFRFFKGCTLIKPNHIEASRMIGREIVDEESLAFVASSLSHELDCSVVITRGPKGISFLDKGASTVNTIPVVARQVYDVCGAGDTVNAALAMALSCGSSLEDAVYLANYAAGIVIEKAGVATVSVEELKCEFSLGASSFLRESIEVNNKMIENELGNIEHLARLMFDAYMNKRKILVFGNGGSASDAQHLVGELVGRFKLERSGLPALCLNSETASMTAIANDFGYEAVFERQVEAFAHEGDLVIGISTSGNSKNVLNAISKAKAIGAVTVGLTGSKGNNLAAVADFCIKVPSDNTPRIQEAHGIIIHIICELLEAKLSAQSPR